MIKNESSINEYDIFSPSLSVPVAANSDSRFFRRDKRNVPLKSPSVTYPKQDIRLLEDL